MRKYSGLLRPPQQVSERLDQLIAEIKSVIEGNSTSWRPVDRLLLIGVNIRRIASV